MTLPVAAVFALVAVSAAVGLVAVRVATVRVDRTSSPGEESGLMRLRAHVGTGQEQVLVALVRELRLAGAASDVSYGALYLETTGPTGFLVRTRSMLGRGLMAPILTRAERGYTEVTYSIVQLPADEDLIATALDFEVQLVAALRRVAAGSSIRLRGGALRDVGRAE